MLDLRTCVPADFEGMAGVWNATFAGGPNFVRVSQGDLLRRVIDRPSFDPSNLLVAVRTGEVVGFVHFGFRSNLWSDLRERRLDHTEGHIYALVAPDPERSLMEYLFEGAIDRLAQGGAERVLLGPSWVHGTQPFYNGIAGGYEMPGLDPTRRELARLAGARSFAPLAHYATPELNLGCRDHVASLQAQGDELMERARGWGLRRRLVTLDATFFPRRRAVLLARGSQTVAMTAYGLWQEYAREYGRSLFGITSVQVAQEWRGKGLGKLIMILAMEAAMGAGAEGLHLHVSRENRLAWRLYHEALGFQPKWTWLTLARPLV